MVDSTRPTPLPEIRPVSATRVRIDGKFFARGRERLRLRGVTYGPFAPAVDGTQFPDEAALRRDFEMMRAAGINALRTYHVPPKRLLELADVYGLNLLIDVPWPKHLCFLESREAQAHARRAVVEAARLGARHRCILGYSVCNEIAPNIVRWHGARRIERFIGQLADIVKQHDPEGLTTYANYPPTEYLDLSRLDFATFNVYLHDREAFRKYLFRLQHLVGDRPLVLGELGMDTLRHGEDEQAEFLEGHLRKSVLMGLAGTFVFSWTDDWHTGGHAIEDWAFGVTDRSRALKRSFHGVRDVYQKSPTQLLPETPRISVVVCTYNGGRTLDECLHSLERLDYPNYELIVVDDGSIDDTRAILKRHPSITAIHQLNLGLSAARNVGLQKATGEIVAYTDSDCVVDPHWLTHLAYQFYRTGAAAAGGPNLSPEDGRTAACVAAAPGQPTHVLESDQEAEHIPGCNMAFRRDVLLAINGFDPMFRKAGDDVDICWRLQQAGYWITFSPGAFVWHHRRHSPRAYLRQQAGYGEAEAQLWFKHPDRFTSRGHGKWRGILYGDALQGLRLARPIIYRGTFAAGLFQTVYQPGPAHWAMLPSTLEWHILAFGLAVIAIPFPALGIGVAAMLLASLIVALLQARQAHLPTRHDGLRSRLLVAVLCYAQPLVRSWHRYRTRFFSEPIPTGAPLPAPPGRRHRMPLAGRRVAEYWCETGAGRFALLDLLVAAMNENRWVKTLDAGWAEWDFQVQRHPWTVIEVLTSEEDHGGGRLLIRVQHRLRSSSYLKLLVTAGLTAAALAAGFSLVERIEPWILSATAFAALCLSAAAGLWWSGCRRASQVISVVDRAAASQNMLRMDATREEPAPACGWLSQTVRRLFQRDRSPRSRASTPVAAPIIAVNTSLTGVTDGETHT